MALAWLALALLCAPAYGQRVGPRSAGATSRPARPVPAIPQTRDDLLNLQAHIESAYKKGLAATVSVTSRRGQGSGVIVSKDGLVLTAGHVAVEGGLDVSITLADGRRVQGRVLGIDRTADAGMVQILDKAVYPFAEVGEARELGVGQWAIALGHPGGYRRDRPPVLRLGRIIGLEGTMAISTNTLVGGDSGGPLFDLDGRVIGIHSRIGEATAANIHVPIGVFAADWDRLVRGDVWGALPRPNGAGMLGVLVGDHPNGTVVQSVLPNSTGAKAGLQAGDVITALDGRAIRNRQSLFAMLARRRPEDEVRLDVVRDGQTRQVTVVLGTGQ